MPTPDERWSAAGERCGGTIYTRPELLGPRQIRSARFAESRFGRRGLDPGEVRRFLARVAAEVADLQAEVIRVREESHQVKEAMRRWQSRHAPTVNRRGYR